MRIVCLGAAIALVGCVSARDPVEVYFANTVLVTQPFGEVDRLLLSPDHTYVMYGMRYPEGHGAWSYHDGAVCLMPGDTPETRGQSFCNSWTGRRVGDHWEIEVGGQRVPMTIAAGRLRPMAIPAER
jgi:hypothetical protein